MWAWQGPAKPGRSSRQTRSDSIILGTHQIPVTNCNDKAVLAAWMAGSEIPVQTVLRSGHSLSQGKAGDAAKTPSAWPPHPSSTLQRARGGCEHRGCPGSQGWDCHTTHRAGGIAECQAGGQGQMKETWKETKH